MGDVKRKKAGRVLGGYGVKLILEGKSIGGWVDAAINDTVAF